MVTSRLVSHALSEDKILYMVTLQFVKFEGLSIIDEQLNISIQFVATRNLEVVTSPEVSVGNQARRNPLQRSALARLVTSSGILCEERELA